MLHQFQNIKQKKSPFYMLCKNMSSIVLKSGYIHYDPRHISMSRLLIFITEIQHMIGLKFTLSDD